MCRSFYGDTPSGCMDFTSTLNQHNALVVCYDFIVAFCCYLNTCVSKVFNIIISYLQSSMCIGGELSWKVLWWLNVLEYHKWGGNISDNLRIFHAVLIFVMFSFFPAKVPVDGQTLLTSWDVENTVVCGMFIISTGARCPWNGPFLLDPIQFERHQARSLVRWWMYVSSSTSGGGN